MDSLGCYGNISLMTNNGTSSSMWSNNHQYHQIHHEDHIFSQEMTNPISPLIPISVVPNRPHNNVVLLRTPSPFSDFGINNIPTKTVSVDSLDCLLSATDSINTDTSIDDDGIFSSPQQPSPSPCYEITKMPSSTSKRTHDQMTQVLSFEGGENLKNSKNSKKPRTLEKCPNSSNISFQQPNNSSVSSEELDSEAIQQMKEMVYRAAAFRPVNLGAEIADKPKRKNVKISSDPQTVAARQRRERISERIRVLQRLVPGGNKMDTASMLDEAANYLKFLRSQVTALEGISGNGLGNYKLDHQVNFNNHHLLALESMNNHSLFSMHNLFPYQITPSSLHQPKY